jgi:hypothetical protein
VIDLIRKAQNGRFQGADFSTVVVNLILVGQEQAGARVPGAVNRVAIRDALVATALLRIQ